MTWCKPTVYNRLFTAAWRDHDLPLPHPIDSGGAGQLPDSAAHDRRQGSRLSKAQPGELVRLQPRRLCSPCGRSWSRGGADTGWTFYTPYSTMYANSEVTILTDPRGLHRRLLLDHHRAELHRHHSPLRAPGLGWFKLPLLSGPSTRPASSRSWERRWWPSPFCWWPPNGCIHIGIFDPAVGGDPVLFQHSLLVLLPPGGLHHDPAVNGGDK